MRALVVGAAVLGAAAAMRRARSSADPDEESPAHWASATDPVD